MPTRPTGLRSGVLWAPGGLHRELENFLACEDEWPAYSFWVAARTKKLYERALRWGSSAQWAEHLGLAVISRGERAQRERRIRVEAELRSLFCRHRWEYMPSRATLRTLRGRKFSRDLVDSGGITYWSTRLGVPVRAMGVERAEEQTAYELSQFLAGRTQWPSKREFEAAGRASLLQVVYRREGSVWWANRLGLEHPRARPRKAKGAIRDLE